MSEDLQVPVEVAYALPHKQLIITLNVDKGTSLYDAAVQSGISAQFEGLDLDQCAMGIFGKVEKNPKQTVVRAGDRIEIYRPLIADPKEVRKKRAAKAKAQREGGGQ